MWCSNMKNLLIILILILTLSANGTVSTKGPDLAVIVSKKFDIDKLEKNDIKRIFLGKTKRINDAKITIVELKGANFKEKFYNKVLNKTESQLHSYWTTLIFTGKSRPPLHIDPLERIKKKLKSDKLIITYLPIDMVTDEMKIVHMVKD